MTTEEAAEFLGYKEKTLRDSRSSGILAGVEPPRYVKRGQRVIYAEEDLVLWLSQFKKITNTAQSSI